MVSKIITRGLLALTAAGFGQTQAHAGGFSWGEASTDILYERSNGAAEAGVIYVNPHRKFDTINGASSSDSHFSQEYFIPDIAVMGRLSDMFACAFTYTRPFGGDSKYGAQAQAADAAATPPTAYSSKKFHTNEYGGTCDVSFELGKGRLHFIGGGFMQDFDYEAVANIGTLRLQDDSAFGYRLGIGYDIPEYALRAQLMYRSEIKHEADGDFTRNPAVLPLFPAVVDASGYGTLPQSLKLNLQSGIAPGWLVYGSVEWTDWSVLKTLNYNINILGDRQDVYNWRDGWTITGGVGHKFTDKIAGTLNVRWDKGVGSGADIMTDTWTVGVGAAIDCGPGQLRVGGGVSYLTSGSQSTAKGASFNATADGDWAYALTASYNVKF
ncbi:long-chain fatty acid transport protein [Neorhizobium galegae]|uniref:OmpP1/FadL family transporter n=1 Tax=Neorhizobium galegae TaxID=399 RepID=UPI001AE63ACF|nr:outer membrane protein transport protein [Neorhizobium galegae]MBP2559271.1 long-chain fatty acid transport protein [Neorhizobium galegae]